MNTPGSGSQKPASTLMLVWLFVQRLLWRVVKWIAHKWTGLSELERICAANHYQRDPALVLALDAYFARSKTLAHIPALMVGPGAGSATAAATAAAPSADAKSGGASDSKSAAAAAAVAAAPALALAMDTVLDLTSLPAADQELVSKTVTAILKAKAVPKSRAPALLRSLEYALGMMRALNVFAAALDAERSERYSSENAAHEKELMALWTALRPDTRLSARISTDWEEIGFQGRDPATDFRGMGVFGLRNLLELSEHYPAHATAILRNSTHKNWFSYAITGLNLTHDLFTSLYPKRPAGPVPNAVRSPFAHFYLSHGVSRRTFLALYALYFVRLNNDWIRANPPNVMSFKPIHDRCFADLQALAAAHRLTKPNPLPMPDIVVAANTAPAAK